MGSRLEMRDIKKLLRKRKLFGFIRFGKGCINMTFFFVSSIFAHTFVWLTVYILTVICFNFPFVNFNFKRQLATIKKHLRREFQFRNIWIIFVCEPGLGKRALNIPWCGSIQSSLGETIPQAGVPKQHKGVKRLAKRKKVGSMDTFISLSSWLWMWRDQLLEFIPWLPWNYGL